MSRIFVAVIRAYQRVSRVFPASCRYEPTCSEYTVQALQKYGAISGAWMGVKRIVRCHPFAYGGHDPVP